MPCPYCGKKDKCAHLLLLVDKTFRTTEGGILMEAFNRRWSTILEREGLDADEDELFADLLWEVERLSDSTSSSEVDELPGMSSAYELLYVATPKKGEKAQKLFRRNDA